LRKAGHRMPIHRSPSQMGNVSPSVDELSIPALVNSRQVCDDFG
jgi:hypothetical protein